MIGSGISSGVSRAGVAEHQALVAGAAGVHALADVARLLVNRRQHRAGLGVEAVLRAGVADVLDDLADDLLEVDVAVRRDFAGDDGEAGRDERLARDARDRILREDRVEDAVGNLVGDLVGMPFGNGLGRKQMAACAPWRLLLGPAHGRPQRCSQPRGQTARRYQTAPEAGSIYARGMKRVVHLPQPRLEHVRVDLRRRQVGVAEHGLDRAQIGAALEQVRRKRVAQDVRTEVRADAGLPPVAPSAASRSRCATSRAPPRALTNSHGALAPLDQRRPRLAQVAPHPVAPPRRRAARCAACCPCRDTAGSPDRAARR